MARRHGLLVALLVYVTLDLSIAAMPGAFVFDAGGSVESAHRRCERGSGEVVVRAEPASARCLPAPPVRVTGDTATMIRLQPRPRSVARRLPRASVALPVPSEDPH